MPRTIAAVAGLVLIVLSGAVNGVITNRWQVAPDLGRSIAAIEQIPRAFGRWEGQTSEVRQEILDAAGIAGYFSCQYVNRETGNVVSVLLVCGKPGPIAVHPPDVCYRGQGFETGKPPQGRTIEVPGLPQKASAGFMEAKFEKPNAAIARSLQVLWSWTADGDWHVPTNPRVAFARYHALYKLYVVRELPLSNESTDKDPSVEFVREFLPEMNRVLFTEE